MKREDYAPDRTGENCPQCNTPTIWRRMPCPEGKPGCLTIHWGWHCPECGDFFRKIKMSGKLRKEMRSGA